MQVLKVVLQLPDYMQFRILPARLFHLMKIMQNGLHQVYMLQHLSDTKTYYL
jgi:hypothetical protein